MAFHQPRSNSSIYPQRTLTQQQGIKVDQWVSASEFLAGTQEVYPDSYLKTHWNEADLVSEEKTKKQKGIIPRSTKAEEMPETVNNKDFEPGHKRVCCLLTGNTCLLVQTDWLLIF